MNTSNTPAAKPLTLPISESEGVKLIKDVSIIGAVIVVIVIIMVSVTMYLVITFLRNVVDRASKDLGPVGECAAQISASQGLYEQQVNPTTKANYTQCEAANLAIQDVTKDQYTKCPKVTPPYVARPPYSVYIATQCRPPPPASAPSGPGTSSATTPVD